MTFVSSRRLWSCRYALPVLLLLVLCGCSDLLFGLGEDPGEQLLVVRGSEILRVGVGSGDVDVAYRLDTSPGNWLLSESGVLHAAMGLQGLMGLDVCTGATVYEYPDQSATFGLSHNEDELFLHHPVGHFEVPEVLVLSTGTGQITNTLQPLRAFEMHLIPAGPAYQDGAVIARGNREVTRPFEWPTPEIKLYILDSQPPTVLDSISSQDLGMGRIRGVIPDRTGHSIYVFSNHSIVEYDLASQTPVNQIPGQVRNGIPTYTVLADGRVLVTDLGYNLSRSSGEMYFVSPDLQQVDTVDVGDLTGEWDRPTAATVVDVQNERAFVVSPDVGGWRGWGDPQPVRLLVIDLARKELVKILDLGMFTLSPPLYRYPDC